MVSEDGLRFWATAPSDTEITKCDNAVAAVRKAINAHAALANREIRVFAQGSYCNRTNVREDSDVDVCVLCSDSMFYDLPAGMSPAQFNLSVPAAYGYAQLKNDVGAALTSYFAKGHMTRGRKAFDIKENTYRIAADAVPCFVYKNLGQNPPLEGVAFVPDGLNASRIVNWPEQNYQNGVAKNTASGRRFKDMARILKRLCYRMKDGNIAAANCAPSFLLECLAYNVPYATLCLDTYRAAVSESLRFLYHGTQNPLLCGGWTEVNEQKRLFEAGQPWTPTQVNEFVVAGWQYLEF